MPAEFDISPVLPATPTTPPPVVTPSPMTPNPMPKTAHSNRALKWLVLAAVGLFVITVVVLLRGGSSFAASGVIVELKAPDQATSGDAVTYTLTYRNDTKVTLSDMSFRLFYPPHTIVIKDGQATTPESESFVVDQLNPGQSGTKEFPIYMVGDKGTIQTARVHLIFKAGTLASSFEKDASAVTTITTLPVTLTLVAPPTAVSGQPIQYILDIRNDTTQDLSDLKAVFTYPDGFTIQKMQPQPDEGNTTWHVNQLKTSQGTRITVDGVLTGNEREAKTVAVSLRRNVNGQYVDYVDTDASTIISSPLLSTTITTNSSRTYTSFAGDTLRYSVAYANNSPYALLGLTMKVVLEGDMYDLAQLRADNGSFDDGTKTVTFDSSGVPALSNLRPGQKGVLTFSVPLKPGLTGSSGSKSFFVKATAKLSTSNVPSGVDGGEVFATDSLITKISSQPSMTQSLLYDGGAGSGPMPPVAGQETTVTVSWQVTNPGNDVRTAKVVATLPPGVTFKNNATATMGTAPTFNAATNQVTWNIGTLPFGAGSGGTQARGQFQVSFKPSSNQTGQSIPVVNAPALTGTDSFTGQNIQVTLQTATTDDVVGHSGQGQVQ